MRETTVLSKKQLGQFFTVNSDYILSGLEKYVWGKEVVDPFAGSGDLLDWALKNGARSVKGFDVDRNYVDGKRVFYGDSLKQKRSYKFILTNPPYLNVNKANQKTKDLYLRGSGFEDLYQAALNSILDSEEGIVIVPINFLSAENSAKIRKIFFSKFKIPEMNYFKQPVFPDTTYNVIAFYYRQKGTEDSFTIRTHVYPENESIKVELEKRFDWAIGGRILKPISEVDNFLGVRRLVEDDIQPGRFVVRAAYNHVKEKREYRVNSAVKRKIKSNIILLKAIDSGSEEGKIALEDIRRYKVDCLVSKPTSRHMVYLVFEYKQPSISEQKRIIELFNKEINRLRGDQFSLFLTNYRDKNRKRISFDFVYKFINYLYFYKILGKAPGGAQSLFAKT